MERTYWAGGGGVTSLLNEEDGVISDSSSADDVEDRRVQRKMQGIQVRVQV